MRGQSGSLHGRLPLLDVFGPGGHQQHVEHVGILFRGTYHLIVVAHFFHGKRNVLVRLHLDLSLELVFTEILGHLNDFRDRGIARDRDRGEPALGAGALHGPANCLADGLCVDDGLFIDGVVRRRLRCIRLNPVLATRHRELD